jgi:SAM-dependent methyltransferase
MWCTTPGKAETELPGRRAREFWDARAEEDAFYFVDNRLEYGSPDLERFWAQGERDLEVLLEVVGAALPAGVDVVEIGCGVGRLTRGLAARAASVRALDVSPRMIERAQSLNPGLAGVTWLVGDGESLAGVEPASADVVVSHVVFQHIADPSVTLGYVREIGRVLRPGGWAVFQFSNDPGVHERPRGLGERARALLRRGPRGQDHPDWRGSAIELDALRAAAGDGGMDVERLAGEGTQYCVALTRRRG